MSSIIVLGVALLALTTSSAPTSASSSPFPKLSDFFREAEEIRDEPAKREIKPEGLRRMIEDAVAAVGWEEIHERELQQLRTVVNHKSTPGGFFGRLILPGAINAAARLGQKLKSYEGRLRKEIQYSGDKERVALLTKVANNVKEAASKFQAFGEGKYVEIRSNYKYGRLTV